MSKSIPIRVTPFFWVTAALIGWLNSQSLPGTLIWVVVIFISILVHELGHAWTARLFGQRPRIELAAFGGLTIPHGPKLPFWKEFLVVLNGPLCGFLLFGLASVVLIFVQNIPPMVLHFLGIFRFINLFWTLVNLFPILPMDGGQLLRIGLEAWLGIRGIRITHMFSLILSCLLAMGFFYIRQFLLGAIFFLFTYENFINWSRSRQMNDIDKDTSYQKELQRALLIYEQGDTETSKKIFVDLRAAVKSGLIFQTATFKLAEIYFQEKNYGDCLELLKPFTDTLPPTLYPLFLQSAFLCQQYDLVLKVAPETFKVFPQKEIALVTSMAAAQLKETKASIGWLQAAQGEGLMSLKEILQDPYFDPIRQDRDFKIFLSTIL